MPKPDPLEALERAEQRLREAHANHFTYLGRRSRTVFSEVDRTEMKRLLDEVWVAIAGYWDAYLQAGRASSPQGKE